jgi:hypothetical protein
MMNPIIALKVNEDEAAAAVEEVQDLESVALVNPDLQVAQVVVSTHSSQFAMQATVQAASAICLTAAVDFPAGHLVQEVALTAAA